MKNKKIQDLKEYFEKESSVLLAFIFGSQAKSLTWAGSDWDIGVYFKPKEYLELETEEEYPKEDEIWSDLIKILETDNVDFLVLNRARPTIVYNALRTGIPLTMKDKGLYLDLLCKASYEAMDWWQFVFDFYKISEKAHSLLPEERAKLFEHLRFLENELEEYEKIKEITKMDYFEDGFKRKIIERWVENLVMGALDIAKIVLASEKKSIPHSYKEILEIFVALYVDDSMSKEFAKFAALRNIVAHEYLDLRWERIYKFVQQADKFYSKFVQKVKRIIEN